MNENKNHGEDREKMNDMGSAQNANTNDMNTHDNARDNSGMHPGGSTGSSYRREGSAGSEGPSNYGSQSDPQGSTGSRMNEQRLNDRQRSGQGSQQYHRPEEQQYGQSGQHERKEYGHTDQTIGHDQQKYGQTDQKYGQDQQKYGQNDSRFSGKEDEYGKEAVHGSSTEKR